MSFIELRGVSYSYDKKNVVFSGLDLSIGQNGVTAITGPNGSGKTTLTKLIMGILKPDSGRVLIKGQEAYPMSLGKMGSIIGYLFQNPELQIFANTVAEDISFASRFRGIPDNEIDEKVDMLLERLNLEGYRDSSPFNLSYGEKQRLAIAGILANGPEYLILDEPTTGLDYKRKKQLRSILIDLLEGGIGVCLISHDQDFIEYFDARTVRLSKEGRICQRVG